MPEQLPSLQFEDVSLDEARRLSRGPRMELMLYDTLRQKIQSLSPEIRPECMKNYLLRIAREFNVPVTVRRVPDGVICWRSSEADLQQAQETASRLQTGQHQGPAHRGRRKRPS